MDNAVLHYYSFLFLFLFFFNDIIGSSWLLVVLLLEIHRVLRHGKKLMMTIVIIIIIIIDYHLCYILSHERKVPKKLNFECILNVRGSHRISSITLLPNLTHLVCHDGCLFAVTPYQIGINTVHNSFEN